MSKDKNNDGEIERRQVAPNDQPMIVRRDLEASRKSLERVARGAEGSQTMGDLVAETYAATWVLCNDILQVLEPISEYRLPDRDAEKAGRDSYSASNRGSRESHLRVNSQEVAALLSSRYDQLGFKRVRCYVKASHMGWKVATYDIMVPTWNGSMLINPEDSWAGSESQWIGFRPATGPSDIKVIPAAQLPLKNTDKDEVPDRAAHKAYSKDKFHWAQADEEWQVRHRPDLSVCKLFITETKDFLTEVIGENEKAIDGLRDVLNTARGDHLLQLDSDTSGNDAPRRAPQDAPDKGEQRQAGGQQDAPKGRRGPEPGDISEIV